MVPSRPAHPFLWVFLAQAVLVVAWALATPLDAAPDEHHHVGRAASVVRLELVGSESAVGGGARDVRLPSFFDRYTELSGCFAFNAPQDASCSPGLGSGGRTVEVTTNAGEAPPGYYAAVGWPLLSATRAGVYVSRIASGLASVAFLAAAVALATRARRRSLAIGGIVVSWTPMAQFLAGVVNPSSLEIGSAALLWTAGAVLVTVDPDDDDAAAVGGRAALAAGVAAATFVLSRQLSPLWLAVIAATLLGWAAPGRLRVMLADRRVRLAAATTAAAGVLAVLWLVAYRPLASTADEPGALDLGRVDALGHSLGRLGYVYRSGIGIFGWLDTFLPSGVELAWTGLLGLVVGVGAVAAGRRRRLVLAALAATVVVLPALIESTQLDTLGATWQGRYTLPLAMGLPILAGLACTDSMTSRLGGLSRAIIAVAAAGQLVAFYVALRRYAVGSDGPIWFVGRSVWDAPLPSAALLALGTIGVGATAVALWRVTPADAPAR